MKKKDLLKKLYEKKERKPQPIKIKLDFDRDEDGAPDSYSTTKKHSSKEESNATPGFYSQNFNDEGTNVRPLHKNTDGEKFKKNKHSGDNHLSKGHNFTDNSKRSVGHKNWSGDDHIFEIVNEVSSRILLDEAVKQNNKYLLKKD